MKAFRQITIIALTFLSTTVYSQLTLDAELRPRFEHRHGYKTLFPDNVDPASFVSQRTRLNTNFTINKLVFFLSLQDVRVWGDVPQLNTTDKNGISIHQAWGKMLFTKDFSLKVGRQEIVYDDQRIFGNVGWAQQGRSHDAALLSYKKESLKADLGVAFNQGGETLTGHALTTPNTYKSLQYVWFHNTWSNFSASLLFLNNGFQYIDTDDETNNETRYSQTVGIHPKFKKGKTQFVGNAFYQFGKEVANNTLSAYLLGLETTYSFTPKVNATLGVEMQSGNNNGAPSSGKNNAFTPFYGTNHKFNGHMDYFYVGNHINNVGITNIYAKTGLKIGKASAISLAIHNFLAAADISGSNSKQLGTEIDLAYKYQFTDIINFQAGFSQMFASEGLEIVKNNTDNNSNYWGWVMITIKPTLYKTTTK